MNWNLPAPSSTPKDEALNWKMTGAGVGAGVGVAAGVGVGVAVGVPTKRSSWLRFSSSMAKLCGEKVKPALVAVTVKLPPGVVWSRRKLPPASVVVVSELAPLRLML